MSEALPMSNQVTSLDSLSAIYSPALVDGATPCDSLDGQTKDLHGPAPARVSRFRALENEKDMPTNDTCGPLFTASSPSAALQQSLENKLRDRLDVNGSPEYVLTWRELDMPAGVPICALRALARRTYDKDFSGWPTVSARDWKSDSSKLLDSELYANNGTVGKPLARIVRKHIGAKPYGNWGMTKSGAGLNPAFALWLMGFPIEWVWCGERAMQSSRKSRRASSNPAPKPSK